jgi:hypothetical protein
MNKISHTPGFSDPFKKVSSQQQQGVKGKEKKKPGKTEQKSPKQQSASREEQKAGATLKAKELDTADANRAALLHRRLGVKPNTEKQNSATPLTSQEKQIRALRTLGGPSKTPISGALLGPAGTAEHQAKFIASYKEASGIESSGRAEQALRYTDLSILAAQAVKVGHSYNTHQLQLQELRESETSDSLSPEQREELKGSIKQLEEIVRKEEKHLEHLGKELALAGVNVAFHAVPGVQIVLTTISITDAHKELKEKIKGLDKSIEALGEIAKQIKESESCTASDTTKKKAQRATLQLRQLVLEDRISQQESAIIRDGLSQGFRVSTLAGLIVFPFLPPVGVALFGVSAVGFFGTTTAGAIEGGVRSPVTLVAKETKLDIELLVKQRDLIKASAAKRELRAKQDTLVQSARSDVQLLSRELSDQAAVIQTKEEVLKKLQTELKQQTSNTELRSTIKHLKSDIDRRKEDLTQKQEAFAQRISSMDSRYVSSLNKQDSIDQRLTTLADKVLHVDEKRTAISSRIRDHNIAYACGLDKKGMSQLREKIDQRLQNQEEREAIAELTGIPVKDLNTEAYLNYINR